MNDYELSHAELELLRTFIYEVAGISLSEAKKQLVRSRLQKRLRALGLETYREYFELVKREQGAGPETTELINCVTTNKTDFFREGHHFEFIRNTVVPEIARRRSVLQTSNRILAWHAGCSTGEEPYTLGITLKEALASYPGWSYKQLASDIDTNVLSHAEQGIYAADRVAPVPGSLLNRYFLRNQSEGETLYKVRPELQEPITFRQVNLTADEWPINHAARFDIIFCRNVIIYFDRATQQRLFERFQQRLKPGGYLFIGHSESLHGVTDAFENLGRTIYRLPARAAAAAA